MTQEIITSHPLSFLPEIKECVDYEHYCQTRSKVGLGVVPKSLFDSIYLSEDEEEDCVLIDEF
ncbi:hypothetical protein N9I00_00650 [bacterium]|nr:hypothetical protein [bacterium]